MKIVWGMLEPLQEYRVIAERFNKTIKNLTNDELEIDIKLFQKDPQNPIKEIEEGNLDIYQIPTGLLESIVANKEWLKCWEIPFLFKNEEHVEKYIESDHSKKKLKELENSKILPLNYSYAGGFCATVTRRNKDFDLDYGNLSNIQFNQYEYEDMTLENFLINIYQHLPSNILMYELNELLKLKPEIKSYININVSKHLIVSRISMISKNTLSKIPTEYRDIFLNTLNGLLIEERNVIYTRSMQNLNNLKKDPYLGINEISSGKPSLDEEVSFINSLYF